MKITHLLSFFVFFSGVMYAQPSPEEDRHYFYVTIENGNMLYFSENEDGTLSLSTSVESEEAAIYNSFKLYEFEPAFPGTDLAHLKNIYRMVTNRVELLGRLWHNFPDKYSKIDQFYPYETAFYPNDYGTTSPLKNLGANQPLYDLDHINAPGAWGITRGSKKVIVGISDSRIDSTNVEFKDRINYLQYFEASQGIQCFHGSNVAGIAIATADNGYGRPGMCSNCSVVTNGYGKFSHIEELVAAGARVINASWATCNMGRYHKEIEDRINELYEDGILIVAGAGNAKDCNREDDYAPDDYAYPASYEKVISVTGIHSRFNTLYDSTFVDGKGYTVATDVKDRHATELAITPSGKIIPKFQTIVMQFNESIDICAPAKSYLLGNDICGHEEIYGGKTSSTAPYITGIIGLMWTVNYCLDAYETESILKLTSVDIDDLAGNEPYKGKLGSGRVDAYKAVKMARDMKELMGNVDVSGRDFSRFHFRLTHSPYNITIGNQAFRDSSSVDFKARNQIVIKPGTRLAPDKTGYVRLGIDPTISTEECEPMPVKNYKSVYPEEDKRPVKSASRYSFAVNYSSEKKELQIEVKSTQLKKMAGVLYKVEVYTPDNRVIKEQTFILPENGKMNVDINSLKFSNILITYGTRKEYHRIKSKP